MTVRLEVKPEIRGEIDSMKLSRLFRVLREISLMFAKKEEQKFAFKSPIKFSKQNDLIDVMMHQPVVLNSPQSGNCVYSIHKFNVFNSYMLIHLIR